MDKKQWCNNNINNVIRTTNKDNGVNNTKEIMERLIKTLRQYIYIYIYKTYIYICNIYIFLSEGYVNITRVLNVWNKQSRILNH